MEEKANLRTSCGDESAAERKFPSMMDNDSQRGLPHSKSDSLPENVSHVVKDFISNNTGDSNDVSLLGGQGITLCFSQQVDLKPSSCWRFGCLTPGDQWESSVNRGVDKTFYVKDYEKCLGFIAGKNSSGCPVVIKTLVLRLNMPLRTFSSTLADLEDTLTKLQEHLSAVQDVVFELEQYAFCCFSLKDFINIETGLPQTIDRLFALKQIFADLRAFCSINHSLNTKLLFDFYTSNENKPESEMYLSKIGIKFNHSQTGRAIKNVPMTLKSSKLKRIYYWEGGEDFTRIKRELIRDCHAIYLDAIRFENMRTVLHSLQQYSSLEDNPFIDRIVINSRQHRFTMKLPRPSAPLTDTTPRSALIELTIKGSNNTFDLSQLNNDYFPHLAHLCIIGGKMTGHLDSHRVPSLKTLRIELGLSLDGIQPDVRALPVEHSQAILNSGRPWQLVTSQDQFGWALVSYDHPTTNPHDEVKEDAASVLPVIKELMLVMRTQKDADEFQSLLNGKAPLDSAAGHQHDDLLVWMPDRVEKITAFGIAGGNPKLEFNEEIPGKTRNLTSLKSFGVSLAVDGAVLPNLRSMEMNGGDVMLSEAFPELQTLSFVNVCLQSRWHLHAPELRSLSCIRMLNGHDFYLRPEFLPHLSYLRVELWEGSSAHCPVILMENDDVLGLSHVKHVVLGREMTKSVFFDQWRVHHVSHLELAVDAWNLPACWDNIEWQCDTLTINIYAIVPRFLKEVKFTFTQMPFILPRVKNLTVTAEADCGVLLDSEMPNLTECTVESLKMLGPNLWCPALESVRFTGKLPKKHKDICLRRAPYDLIGARPRIIFFDYDREAYNVSWDLAASATGVSSGAGQLRHRDNASVSHGSLSSFSSSSSSFSSPSSLALLQPVN